MVLPKVFFFEDEEDSDELSSAELDFNDDLKQAVKVLKLSSVADMRRQADKCKTFIIL